MTKGSRRDRAEHFDSMDTPDGLIAVLDVIKAAQKHYRNGDVLEQNRLKEELDQIFDECGGDAEEETFEWYFHTADQRSYLSHKLRNQGVDRQQTLPQGKRTASLTRARLLRHLWRINKAKRPLSSRFCQGMVRTHLNQALRVYESAWLKGIGIKTDDPIGALRRRRLKPADHDRIRALVSDRVIPALSRQTREENAAKTWKQSVVLQLAELFARYAPPPDYDKHGIAALPAGPGTFFIRFLTCAFWYFDPDLEVLDESLSMFWRDRKRVMLGTKYPIFESTVSL